MSVLAAVLQARLLAALAGTVPPASPISVVVDAAVVDREALAARLAAGTEPLARRLSASGSSSTSASLLVTGELLDFRVRLELPTTGISTSRCPCTHAELVAHVQQRLARALAARPAHPPPPVLVLPSRSQPRSPSRATATGPTTGTTTAGLRRLGRWGVALVGLGGLGLGAGVGTLASAAILRDERVLPRTDLQPYGLAAVAVGTSVLASGAVLLLLDRRLRRARPPIHP